MTDRPVLLVDDSTITRKLLKRLLENIGCARVLEAGDGREALQRLRAPGEELPGLVLLDWNMPIMSGKELLETMRADATLRAVPVIMVTSESAPERVIAAMRAGAQSYVVKPFHANEVTVKVREALALARVGDARSPLHGELAEVGLPALIQLVAASALTGTIAVRAGGRLLGELGVVSGELRRCAYEGRRGNAAFLAMARLRDGSFELQTGAGGGEADVVGPPMALLMEAMREQDESLRA